MLALTALALALPATAPSHFPLVNDCVPTGEFNIEVECGPVETTCYYEFGDVTCWDGSVVTKWTYVCEDYRECQEIVYLSRVDAVTGAPCPPASNVRTTYEVYVGGSSLELGDVCDSPGTLNCLPVEEEYEYEYGGYWTDTISEVVTDIVCGEDTPGHKIKTLSVDYLTRRLISYVTYDPVAPATAEDCPQGVFYGPWEDFYLGTDYKIEIDCPGELEPEPEPLSLTERTAPVEAQIAAQGRMPQLDTVRVPARPAGKMPLGWGVSFAGLQGSPW